MYIDVINIGNAKTSEPCAISVDRITNNSIRLRLFTVGSLRLDLHLSEQELKLLYKDGLKAFQKDIIS